MDKKDVEMLGGFIDDVLYYVFLSIEESQSIIGEQSWVLQEILYDYS